MGRFAHIADVHLGSNREKAMRDLEIKAFSDAMDRCISEKVDFIIFSGDLFHTGIPDLSVVNEALRKISEVKDTGIPVYVIYGSHDYTPAGTSVIDLLTTARMLQKVVKPRMEGGKLCLDSTRDPATGARLWGISARSNGLERKYYEILDRESLEAEDGFKIFVFHSGITEFKPPELVQMETIPISYFPRNFDYYAGGHIHSSGIYRQPGYDNIVFPGPLFTGYGKDLENSARGEKRGFYIVDFDSKVRKIQFIDTTACSWAFLEFDATGKSSSEFSAEVSRGAEDADIRGRVVVLKLRGTIESGRTSDVDIGRIRERLISNGALHVYVNRHSLFSREYSAVNYVETDLRVLEKKLILENIGNYRGSIAALGGNKGAERAEELLTSMKQESKLNESKADYASRKREEAIALLGINNLLGADER
ncbi:MAG: DNA repair exonuclease [Candidatus Thermoplasmatota archaeon]|nr:DNA repair exonuclease [Candidatus Thermoplasmatota archaeon]